MLRPGNLEDDGADILIASARMSIAHVGYSLRADWGESGNDAQGVDLRNSRRMLTLYLTACHQCTLCGHSGQHRALHYIDFYAGELRIRCNKWIYPDLDN